VSSKTRGNRLNYCMHNISKSTQPSTLRGTVKWVPTKGRWCSASGKVTASLAESNGSLPPRGWLKVICGLTACTPGSAPGPMPGNQYGKPLPLIYPSSYWKCKKNQSSVQFRQRIFLWRDQNCYIKSRQDFSYSWTSPCKVLSPACTLTSDESCPEIGIDVVRQRSLLILYCR